MFFRRRHHRHCPLHLILLLLGFKAGRHCAKSTPEQREEMKGKARLFRSKLKDAFSVWHEEEKKEDGEASAEQQG